MTQTNVSILAPGIATLVKISSKILLACYRYREHMKDFENDIAKFIAELESLSDVTEELNNLLDEGPDDERLRKIHLSDEYGKSGGSVLTTSHGCLTACNAIIQELAQHFEPLTKARSKTGLTWPLESTGTIDYIQAIQKERATLQSIISVLVESDLSTDGHKQPHQSVILSWYNTSDPETNHNLSVQSREPNTGTWIFDNEGFKKWETSAGEVLWLHGIPGSGKTILCSTIINHMLSLNVGSETTKSNHTIVYYYFDFSDNRKQTLKAFLRSIISQLISRRNNPSKLAEDLFKACTSSGRNPSIEELFDVCAAELARSPKTFLILDALDESPLKEREIFFDSFLKQALSLGVSILVTSRREPDIEKQLKVFASHTIGLEASLVDEDVRTHVKSVISTDSVLNSLRPPLQKEILDSLVAGAGGMFRWAICQIDKLKKCLTPNMIREELKTMPRNLDETYDRILSAVPPTHQAFVQCALHWLAFSARPILLEELAEAAVVRPETGHFDPVSSRLLNPTIITDLCGVLVNTCELVPRENRTKWLDEKGELETRGRQNFSNRAHVTIVSLSHYTVKEYIMSARLQNNALLSYHTSVILANSFLAKSCLFYLFEFNEGKISSQPDFEEYPLLEYSARNWMHHWRLAGGQDCDASLRNIYERFISPENRDSYTNWLNVWNPDFEFEDWVCGQYGQIKVSADLFQQPLYWAAFLGDTTLVQSLVNRGADVQAREGFFESAFGAAVFFGHMDVVEYFLTHGADPNMRGTRFGSALQIAAAGGSKPMVQRLIDAGADVNARGGKKWETALIAAAAKQYDDIVTLLLENKADLNIGLQAGGSALYRAAEAGDMKLAMILLGAGADANGSDREIDAPPLFAAVHAGSLPLVQFLIRKGANVNKGLEIADSRYPLIEAIDRNHSQIARTLLTAGADPNVKGKWDKTALDEAIGRRDMTIFRLLLDAGADINTCSSFNENCFHKAVAYRQYEMAKELKDRGADLGTQVLIDAVVAYKKAPWILTTLLDRGVDVNVFSEYSGTSTSTALHVAVRKMVGDDDAARLLLERKAYVNAIDQHYETPLSLAISSGNITMVKELIQHGADIKRTVGSSPFENSIKYACEEEGTLEIADMLLQLGVDINVDTEKALYYPLQSRNTNVLAYLVDKGINLDRTLFPKDRAGIGMIYRNSEYTPVQYVAEQGDTEMFKALLNFGADINGLPGSQGTTLHYGLLSKKKDMVEFLLENGAKVDDSVSRRSTICKAIANDMAAMVPILLENGADVNANEHGQSPLAAAFSVGDRGLMKLLSSKGARFLETDSKVAAEAISKESLEDLQFLLDNGLDPNVKYRSETVVEKAIEKTDTSFIELLTQAGARLNGEELQHEFGRVCKTGHLEMATLLLEKGTGFDASKGLIEAAGVPKNLTIIDMLLQQGADVHSGDRGCFQAAARGGCQKVLTRLLEQPMNATQRAECLGKALQAAAWQSNLALCKWLLDDQGADINHSGQPYGSPLQAALSFVHYNDNNDRVLFKTLIEYGANVNPPLVEKPKETWRKIGGFKPDPSTSFAPPLCLALVGKGWHDSLQPLAKDLLHLGADVNGIGGQYHTPLQAAAYSCPSMLALLLEAGADVNAVGGRFGTALHAAAWNKDVDSARLLLAHGADARISAGKYGSVLQAAAKGNRFDRRNGIRTKEMMNLLFEAGADVHAQDGYYGSAVQMAAVSGNIGALEWLVAHGADIHVKGGRRGNVYRAALKNLENNKSVEWGVVSWLEQHYGRDGWD